MNLTSPSLTISALSPKTCARRASAFRAARGKGWTQEVCSNGVYSGASRDRDLRALDRFWDKDKTRRAAGNLVTNIGFNRRAQGPGVGT